jgi:hypothetical protein
MISLFGRPRHNARYAESHKSLMDLLARISHQAALNTDKALPRRSEARMIKNTVCYSSMPITVQAGLRVRKLAPVILVRNAG